MEDFEITLQLFYSRGEWIWTIVQEVGFNRPETIAHGSADTREIAAKQANLALVSHLLA